jgi:hypothetical protein
MKQRSTQDCSDIESKVRGDDADILLSYLEGCATSRTIYAMKAAPLVRSTILVKQIRCLPASLSIYVAEFRNRYHLVGSMSMLTSSSPSQYFQSLSAASS